MTIREYAKQVGFPVVGKLHRMPDGKQRRRKRREVYWTDEAGNEYYRSHDGKSACIVTTEGAVI